MSVCIRGDVCTGFSRLKLPEQALGGIPLGLGLVVKMNLKNIHVCNSVAACGDGKLYEWSMSLRLLFLSPEVCLYKSSTCMCVLVCFSEMPSCCCWQVKME